VTLAALRISVFALALVALGLPAHAQLRFDSWTTENGLPQNSINDILQTRDGYLWLATFGGLVRFDGRRFAIFDRSVPGIESQRIRALHEDRGGTLWAATEDGMLIRYRNERFTTFTMRDGRPQVPAVRIEEDDAGGLWIAWVGALTRFDGQRFVTVTTADLRDEVMPPPDRVYHDSWWRGATAGLRALVNGQVRTYPIPQTRVAGVNVDRRGNVWVRTQGDGVIRAIDGRLDRFSVREGLHTNSPSARFFEGAAGDVWYSEVPSGRAYRVRDGTGEPVTIPGLPGLTGLSALFVDNEGSTWLGTVGAGLHRVREPAIAMPRDHDAHGPTAVYPVLRDRAGVVWIGHGGLTRYTHGRFTPFSHAPNVPDIVTSLLEDQSGRLWVGTRSGLRYVEHDRLQRVEDSSGLLTVGIFAILEDRAGGLWLATETGLVSYRDGRLTRYSTRDGLPHDRITALFQDRAGVLWIGTFRGVARRSGGVMTAFTEKDGFVGNQVRAFHEDAAGNLWIGTYDGGLYRLCGDQLTRYTRREGLHDNGVFQILEDSKGYFWIGSNTGIFRVDPMELNEFAAGTRQMITSLALGTRDGLATVEVNGGSQPAGFVAPDGKLWFPTMGGVAVLDPSVVRGDSRPPGTLIEEVRLAGEPQARSRDIRIPAGAGALEIRYTAPAFVNPEQVRFRYRLAGLSDEWVYAGDRRVAIFHRIPPGNYTFAVTASNHLGMWSNDGEVLRIVVPPPFWATGWFRFAVAGACMAVLIAAHTGRIRRLRREQARRSVYLQELIDSQERERSRISTEMHDSLGYDLAIVKRRAREGLDRTSADAASGRELGDILAVTDRIESGMKSIAYALRPYHLDKIGLTRSIEALVQEMSQASGIELSASIADIDGALLPDSQIHLYRIVQEGLTNVVKHARARSAKVTIVRVSGQLEVRVEDDGDGFDSGTNGRSRRTNDGFGVIGIRERVQLLGGVMEISSKPKRGTALVVRLRAAGGSVDAGAY
jgi:signal transduction histidine kinase/ligand-binding sensor domain-containing protein